MRDERVHLCVFACDEARRGRHWAACSGLDGGAAIGARGASGVGRGASPSRLQFEVTWGRRVHARSRLRGWALACTGACACSRRRVGSDTDQKSRTRRSREKRAARQLPMADADTAHLLEQGSPEAEEVSAPPARLRLRSVVAAASAGLALVACGALGARRSASAAAISGGVELLRSAASLVEVGCHALQEIDPCYFSVHWARTQGIFQHPEWYKGLVPDSSIEERGPPARSPRAHESGGSQGGQLPEALAGGSIGRSPVGRLEVRSEGALRNSPSGLGAPGLGGSAPPFSRTLVLVAPPFAQIRLRIPHFELKLRRSLARGSLGRCGATPPSTHQG